MACFLAFIALVVFVAAWAKGGHPGLETNIWFTYSAAEESMAELGRSQHEYGSCDAATPIWMYTAGLYKTELDHRGRRYFVSSTPGSCSKGCKSPSLQSQWPSNHPGKFRQQQQQGQCHPVL